MTETYRNQRKFIHTLYELMIEANMNLRETADDTGHDSSLLDSDPQFKSTIQFIRQLNLKAKAHLNKVWEKEASSLLEKLLIEYNNDVDKFVQNIAKEPEGQKLVALYRNYSTLSDEDKKKMLLDKKLLELMDRLSKKTNG